MFCIGYIPLLWANVAIQVQRLHDRGKSGARFYVKLPDLRVGQARAILPDGGIQSVSIPHPAERAGVGDAVSQDSLLLQRPHPA